MHNTKTTFSGYNPAVTMFFFLAAILITMLYPHPFIVGLSFICALAFACLLNGSRAVRLVLAAMLPMIAAVAVINPLFNHQGMTILFSIGGAPVTLESAIYGLMSGFMFASVMLWFSCFNAVFTADRLSYLVGFAAPSVSLVLIMTMRFIPRFSQRFKEISTAQSAVGRGLSSGKLLWRMRNAARIVMVMIAWSLENGIITADSMQARGYGLKPKTRYAEYKFTARDAALLAVLAVLAALAMLPLLRGDLYALYFPRLELNALTPWAVCGAAAFFAFAASPIVLHIKEALVWR